MFQIIGPPTIKLAIIIVEQSMPGEISDMKGLGHFGPNRDPNKTNILGAIPSVSLIDGIIAIAINHFQV